MINSQMPVTQAVMHQAAKCAGIEKTCAFDSGGRVTFAMKLFELNLFVWILYCSWDHYRDFLKTEFLSILKVRTTKILASQCLYNYNANFIR